MQKFDSTRLVVYPDIYKGQDVEIEKDISSLFEKLSACNYPSIVNDPKDFWHLFCTIASPASPTFTPSLKEHTLIIKGEATQINDLFNGIEEIRKLFAQALDNQENIDILPVQFMKHQYLLRSQNDSNTPLSVVDWKDHHLLGKSSYDLLVKPRMQKLCNYLQITCTHKFISEKEIPSLTGQATTKQNIQAFRIEWPLYT